MNDIQLGVITLLKSAITGEKFSLPCGFSVEKAYPILKKHGIQTMGYLGAANCGIPKTDPVMQTLFQHYCCSAVFSQRQLDKISQLFEAFEKNCIDYMPLKGTVLKQLYPNHELRPMADADVLIRMEQYDRIKVIMEALGYTEAEENGHELPWKGPDLYVELHKRLVSNADYLSYFGDGWTFSEQKNGYKHQMSPEDHFVFVFTHFVKHFQGGGIGCRHVTDLWVYLSKYPNMDQAYIAEAMNKLHLVEFYHNIMDLLSSWFDGKQWSDKTQFISDFIFNSGIWGNLKTHDLAENAKHVRKKEHAGKGKWRYFLSRVFPGLAQAGYQYPVLKNAPFLLPIIWVVRWVHIAVRKPKIMKRRLQMLNSANNDEIIAWKRNMEYVGLRYSNNS